MAGASADCCFGTARRLSKFATQRLGRPSRAPSSTSWGIPRRWLVTSTASTRGRYWYAPSRESKRTGRVPTGSGNSAHQIDKLLAEQGRTRRVAVTAPSFLLAPYIVAETALLLSAGERLLHSFVGSLPVQVVALPFAFPAFDVHLLWHARIHDEPTCAWFRNQLIAIHDQLYNALAGRPDRAVASSR